MDVKGLLIVLAIGLAVGVVVALEPPAFGFATGMAIGLGTAGAYTIGFIRGYDRR